MGLYIPRRNLFISQKLKFKAVLIEYHRKSGMNQNIPVHEYSIYWTMLSFFCLAAFSSRPPLINSQRVNLSGSDVPLPLFLEYLFPRQTTHTGGRTCADLADCVPIPSCDRSPLLCLFAYGSSLTLASQDSVSPETRKVAS